MDKPELRYGSLALLALQEASEAYIVGLFERADICRVHAGRITLTEEDMKLAQRLQTQVV